MNILSWIGFVCFLLPRSSWAEVVSSKCYPNPCLNGICIEEQQLPELPRRLTSSNDKVRDPGYRCFCYNGYTGDDCSNNFDECIVGRNRCQNNSTCINDVPEIRCVCPEGYCGKYCELEVNECQSNPCFNGGVCVDKLNNFQCICQSGYSGPQCEVDIDACDASFLLQLNRTIHCENGGTCKDGPGDEYFCVCPTGYNGTRCETIVNECDLSPCQNGGRCEKVGTSFRCVCSYGWSGKTCERPLKLCSDNRCKNDALCMESNSIVETNDLASITEPETKDFYCYCQPDYYGKLCEHRFDECEPNNCQNGATCQDRINDYVCECRPGFVGHYCEIDCSIESMKSNALCLIESITIKPSLTLNVTDSDILSTIEPTATTSPPPSLITPVTDIIVVPSPTIELPQAELNTTTVVVVDNNHNNNIANKIYTPNFNGIDSEAVFKVRRIKRMSSSIKIDFETETPDGTILKANTSKHQLVIYLKNSTIVVQLQDQDREPVFTIYSNVRIDLHRRYSLKLKITASRQSVLFTELSLFEDNSLIHSISNLQSNMTVPCFEQFWLGHSSDKDLDNFKGCLYNFIVNDEEKFIKDAIEVRNITECMSNVCEQNPCRNGATCKQVVSNVSDESNSITTSEWNCQCLAGYRGWLCEEAFCHPDYCHNEGLCILENSDQHLCVCSHGYYGPRCEFKLNLSFPLYNTGENTSFIKYRLPYDLKEFFEIRFRFIAHDLEQKRGLLMFMSEIFPISLSTVPSSIESTTTIQHRTRDFVSLIYDKRSLVLRLNLGQGETILRSVIESNVTEQMVLFGRFKQVFWLLVVPARVNTGLSPMIGRTPLHHQILNVDPFLYVGGHEDWKTHPALYDVRGFKGCIYDIDIRISRESNFTRIDEKLIDNMANIEQCDFDCT